jgi:hypothetical protein
LAAHLAADFGFSAGELGVFPGIHQNFINLVRCGFKGDGLTDGFTDAWNIGLAIFGVSLLIVGYLVFKSGYLPKFLGILVVIAGLGYLIDNLGKLLSPNYNITLSMFTFIGEVLLIFWLLWRGIKGFDKGSE